MNATVIHDVQGSTFWEPALEYTVIPNSPFCGEPYIVHAATLYYPLWSYVLLTRFSFQCFLSLSKSKIHSTGMIFFPNDDSVHKEFHPATFMQLPSAPEEMWRF
jgi:hypothetical protein